MYRFIVVAAIVVVAAVLAPRFAPGIFDRAIGDSAPATVFAPPPPAPAEPAVVALAPPDPARPALAPLPQRAPLVPAGRRTSIAASPDGHYYADVTINGRTVPVMVDTGASTVALTADTARQLGIAPPRSAFTEPVQTANGVLSAAVVTLGEVRIDGVRVRRVEALVLPREALTVNLLGMSFLGRLTSFEAGGGKLVLTE